MFIIDEPYISDVAEKFLVESQMPLLANDFASQSVSSAANFISSAEAALHLEKENFRWVYSNSENAISWITETFGADSDLAQKIDVFKDKAKFRKSTASLFPDITFRKVPATEIATLTFESIGRPFIIKPNVGFISAGVHRVDTPEEWEAVQEKICQETEATACAFPGEVINSDTFVVESIIEGEEYAADAYFDEDNKPVVLNILYHRFSSEQDMSDRLYVTSAKIIEDRLEPIEEFLTDIAALGDYKGLPVHAEIRIDKEGRIRPIEINPLRFAGWCSTDIAYYGYGLNVYEHFANRTRPDWATLLKGKESATYAMGVVERASTLSDEQVFDYGAFEKLFSSLITLRKMNYRTFPLYAFAFFEVSPETEEELDLILSMDPSRFVRDAN
ncbi:ATP-grasp domain-containing protein [Desulfogranum marinum]|uniref:ATP-grasp domain-containing protein n=1 Tax=Desulfogranum marinum TaxID=453220 RepID=UPI001966B809|nr:ATP-grasp domain-containing protein [Desulfogranum marinum]MBM9512248.1 ATP-grasp domain-containing protein [Desulfogranum marinum]